MTDDVRPSVSMHRRVQPAWKSRRPLFVILFLLALTYPVYAGSYWLDVGFLAIFYIVLGLGLNIVVGYAGA